MTLVQCGCKSCFRAAGFVCPVAWQGAGMHYPVLALLSSLLLPVSCLLTQDCSFFGWKTQVLDADWSKAVQTASPPAAVLHLTSSITPGPCGGCLAVLWSAPLLSHSHQEVVGKSWCTPQDLERVLLWLQL